jgi:phosphate:Na+ symporter
MAITQTMVFAGWIDFPTACAIVLGENIGTTITAQLAALGTNINARRTAMAHTFFNIVGAIWMSFIFTHFLKFVLFIMPLDPSNNASLTASLALFHTMFNLINAIVFLAFLPQFASFIEKIIKPKKVEDEELYQLKYLNYYMDAPEIQIYNAKREVTRMADLIMIMFKKFRYLFNTPKEKIDKDLKEINKLEQACDNMQFEISKFLSQCPRENLKTSSINNIAILIKIADELESISDSSQNLVYLLSRSHEKKMKWPQEIIDEINPYINLVYEFLEFISVRMNEKMDDEDFKTAYEIENRIDEFRNMLKKKARKRIEKGSEVKFEILVIDILQHIEHVGDYAMNVARALLEYNG